MSKSAALSQEDLEFLMCHTHFDKDGIMEWHEIFHLLCPTGLMSRTEFMEKYGNADWFCESVFTSDTDINFRKFLQAINAAFESIDGTYYTPKEMLKFSFKIFDGGLFVDGDGDIGPMIRIKECITHQLYGRRLPRYVQVDYSVEIILNRVFGENHDFYVTEEEFLRRCLQDDELPILLAIDVASAGITSKEILMWAFRIFDGDCDGVIGRDEMTKITRILADVLAAGIIKTANIAEKRAEDILKRVFGENHDGNLTEEEFVSRCLQDAELFLLMIS